MGTDDEGLLEERLYRLTRGVVRNVLCPLLGVAGLVRFLLNPSEPGSPYLVAVSLVLVGYPLASFLDRIGGK